MARSITELLAAAMLSGVLAAVANAETAHEHGAVPDFSSNLAGWVANEQDFMAVPGKSGPVISDPAHPYINNLLARRIGTQPTFRVADLTNPNIKSWAKEVMKRENQRVLAGGIGFTPRSSCLPAGVPAFMLFPVVEPIFFVQSARVVLMIFAGDAQIRHIYLDVPHSAHPKPSWYGESVGHYEGDTLVIDTIGFNDKSYVDNFRTPHSDKLHVVERWRLADDMTMRVTFTVEDPDTFNEAWTATYSFHRIERPLYDEEVCAENNTLLFDYHIPIADKADF
ncbi:MAG TPA: hypothetical protein VKC66_10205 [Xanthobacteraceae bacterium]|nr:hypothetical protein [Xanthobacteraceae bacterium]